MNKQEQDQYWIKISGWTIFKNMLTDEFIERLKKDLDVLYQKRRQIQVKNGIGEQMSGTCHHLLGEQSSLDELVQSLILHSSIQDFFDGPYILNSIGAFMNNFENHAYVSKIHRDIRTFSNGYPLLLNLLIMLDDFTLDNGATYLLSGSHITAEKPPEDLFYKYATRAIGKSGDILMFNSNLWHAAGENKSHAPRRCLTLTYSRPFFKQQIDYPRLLGEDYANFLSDDIRQVLGYNALIPSTLEEFYQPPEKRFYKSNQG